MKGNNTMADDTMLEIDVKATVDEVLHLLDDFASDQLPFATARALFNVGLDAKEGMEKELYKKFTIRTAKAGGSRKPWAARAMYVSPETMEEIRQDMKSGKAHLTVASRSKVLGKMLTEGGTRRLSGDREFGVPVLGGGRKNKMTVVRPESIIKTGRNKGKVRKGNTYQDVLANKKGFILPLKKSSGGVLLVRKKPWQKGADDRAALQPMFFMKREVKIKPWWNLRQILAKSMELNFPRRFVEAFNKAMATQKPR